MAIRDAPRGARAHRRTRAGWLALAMGALACGARTQLVGDDVDAGLARRPPTRCQLVSALADCQRTPGCGWLVDGCGAPALPTGCFPRGACATSADCEAGLACRSFDPCAGTPCSAGCSAGAPSSICLP